MSPRREDRKGADKRVHELNYRITAILPGRPFPAVPPSDTNERQFASVAGCDRYGGGWALSGTCVGGPAVALSD